MTRLEKGPLASIGQLRAGRSCAVDVHTSVHKKVHTEQVSRVLAHGERARAVTGGSAEAAHMWDAVP
jgi:hypothetical protein